MWPMNREYRKCMCMNVYMERECRQKETAYTAHSQFFPNAFIIRNRNAVS